MKQLICEMCGSNDLLKQDGVFVCQSCGCKYSVEEAKKMMVEVTVDVSGNAAPLLERAFTFLEESDWDRANEYCEKVLDIDPKCAEAYVGKLMAELKVRKQEALKDYFKPFDDNNNYKKAVSFANENLRNKLVGYLKQVEESYNVKKKRLDMLLALYKKLSSLQPGETKSDYDRQTMHRLNQLNQSKNNLTNLLTTFPKYSHELTSTEQTIKSKEAQVNVLQNKLASLGFFAATQRTALKENIRILQDEIERLTFIATQLKKQCHGYSSEDQIFKKLAEINAEIDKLNHDLRAKQEGFASTLSPQQIVAELTSGIYRPFACEHMEFKHTLDCIDFKRRIKQESAGQYISIGTYKDNYNRKPYKWLVLETKNDKVLVISEIAVKLKKYNDIEKDVTWETCSLRQWLNNEFFNNDFSATEQAVISTATVSAEQNPRFNTNPGAETQDKLFLLSISDAKKYFTTNDARQCCSNYNLAIFDDYLDYHGHCGWWLRSPGLSQRFAAWVDTDGRISKSGSRVNLERLFVRPAMWIDLSGV